MNAFPKLIDADPASRPRIPDTVWDHFSTATWRGAVWDLISDVATHRVRRAFLKAPPEYLVSDDLTWLNNVIWSVHKRDVEMKSLLADRLRERFQAMRAVHGTRAIDLRTYYTSGLLPLDPETVHRRARELFLNGAFPELTDDALESAITQVGADGREGKVYFEANETLLTERCGHYMLYCGGEYLTAIAAHFNGYVVSALPISPSIHHGAETIEVGSTSCRSLTRIESLS